MTSPGAANAQTTPGEFAPLRNRALLLDLEVSQRGKILKIGAVYKDHTFARGGSIDLRYTLQELAGLAQSAACVVGHNLVQHDLEFLHKAAPHHPLLRLPVIDTLVLSPIAFPENPYHRLVKDYKLLRESVNDPVADAVQAGVLFEDEFRSLAGLRQTELGLFDLLHYLLGTSDPAAPQLPAGMRLFFETLGGTIPSRDRALELCLLLFRRWGCASLPVSPALVDTAPKRLALAYTLTWLRVAGSNSVLPPWVRLRFPQVGELVRRLREAPCADLACAYCRKTHNATEQLRVFFGFDAFRPLPAAPDGGSLQQQIVEAGMREESLLAILPTGGGKSLCFQLPALVRNYRRGVLTIVISPLQALMKDQVDGLVRRTNTPFAAALYGLLTPPERGEVLRGISQGDIALLYVSPEQLRNRSFRDAVALREIGCWVFDEAHCLSKWGHDFRPDYLYAGRFIREFSQRQNVPIPPIACFTATAKRDVKEEIIDFFKKETGRDLALFEGGVERDNLRFEVQTITNRTKLERVHDLLGEHIADGRPGHAIVFRATRADAENSAQYLSAKGWRAAHFHAGLTSSEKKRVQDEFLAGAVQVICATNAFGMGIDKEDVRLVIHADTPGSLENYLQEAGRAGRDGLTAQCILLYEEADCERQFRMSSLSELSRRDIAQILRALRKSARNHPDPVVVTTGEILRDEDVQTDIDRAAPDADTKVRAAISWLERAGFVQRDENITNVFQARLLIHDLAEAEAKMQPLNLPAVEKELWLAILRVLINAGPADSVTVDRLALLPEFAAYARGANANPEFISGKVIKTLGSMTQAGLLRRDLLLNAYVRHKIADSSRQRLDRVAQLDRRMLDLLATEDPDPEGWVPLSLRMLNQRLTDDGLESSTELIRSLIKSLSEDGRGFAGTHGSVDLRYLTRDAYTIRLRRSWTAIAELAEKRRRVASVILGTLLAKIPETAPATSELLIEFSFEELQKALDHDLFLRSELKDPEAAIERALMFLHEQRVIVLQQGLAVFRSAMTIRLQPQARKERYKASDYQPLKHHYHERVLQIHVMGEYARRGIERMREALSLVLAYFTMDKDQFVREYFHARPDLLEHATTAQSYQRIVTDLDNPAQVKIVTAPRLANMLILAGPGSGKTRTVVHRCAYLLRVERVRPQAILVCCFSRMAAIELRSRLAALAGDDARGVTVLTYHALALRLLGQTAAGFNDNDLASLIPNATKLLQHFSTSPGFEPDELRDRLLAGFEHILVDEYQDIDQPQYELISAIAGRTLKDPDQKLSILAVGDDDQNIYTFRGANVQFIRRFQKDYQAEVHYLVENYRSTKPIIETANQLIAANSDRMKTGHPIRIDRHRANLSITEQPVQLIRVPDASAQSLAVIAEIRRLTENGIPASNIAVLSRAHHDLAQIRALAEDENIPIRWSPGQGAMPALHHIREIRQFLDELEANRRSLLRSSSLLSRVQELLKERPANPWLEFLLRLAEGWHAESADAELPAQEAIEYFYEACAETRRDFSYGHGVLLSTVHSAKGTEHDHVLVVGAWPVKGPRSAQEEERRAFYVALTRARNTLTLFDRVDTRPSLPAELSGPTATARDYAAQPQALPAPTVQYATLGLDDLNLAYPALFSPYHQIHSSLAALNTGDRLKLRTEGAEGVTLFNQAGTCAARLSRKGATEWRNRLDTIKEVRVLGLVIRRAEQEPEPERRDKFRVAHWEIPLVELVLQSPDR